MHFLGAGGVRVPPEISLCLAGCIFCSRIFPNHILGVSLLAFLLYVLLIYSILGSRFNRHSHTSAQGWGEQKRKYPMGDKGKKDKDKSQKQKVKKQEQKAKKKQDKKPGKTP